MFWRRKRANGGQVLAGQAAYPAAKEATRRAAFLNISARMGGDDVHRHNLAQLFAACRAAALKAGLAQGLSETQIDDEIGALCDADVARFKTASDKAFAVFARESGEIVDSFLANVK